MKKFNEVIVDGVKIEGSGEYHTDSTFIKVIAHELEIKRFFSNKLRNDPFIKVVEFNNNNGDSYISRGEYLVGHRTGNEILIENIK